MKIKLVTLVLLLAMASSVFAQAAVPLSPTDRVKNMANEETTWRWASGGLKLAVGGLIAGFGFSLACFRDNIIGAIIAIPVGVTIMVPGVIIFGLGGYDLLFGSREYQTEYDKLKLASDADRDNQALQYLKDKSAADKQSRQPSFWNAFGLFSMFETPAEREYNGYLKGHSN